MPLNGIDKNPYPNSSEIPDGPAAFLLLAQRLTLMKSAGIGYAADATALTAFISNGDAFTGLRVYYAAADAVVRYNGTAFRLAERKTFVDTAALNAWTAIYGALLEVGSAAFTTSCEVVWNGTAWQASSAVILGVPSSPVPTTYLVAYSTITIPNAGKYEFDGIASFNVSAASNVAYTVAIVQLGVAVKVSQSVQIASVFSTAVPMKWTGTVGAGTSMALQVSVGSVSGTQTITAQSFTARAAGTIS